MSDFIIKNEKFEGPIEMLLSLIEDRKLHISQISLAQVTDDYIAHINTLEKLPDSQTADFLMIASTLLLIKSLSLLPQLPVSEEEKGNMEELEERLRLYQDIRAKTRVLNELFGRNIIYAREETRMHHVVFTPTNDLTLANIFSGIRGVIEALPKGIEVARAMVKKVMSLEEAIASLSERIQKNIKMGFRDFAKSHKERVDVIVSFLAMLELVKQGLIVARQNSNYQEIEMESQSVDVPRYT